MLSGISEMENTQILWWFPTEPLVFRTANLSAKKRVSMRELIGGRYREACFIQFFLTTPDQVLELRRLAPETPNLGGPFLPELDEISLRSAMTSRTMDDVVDDTPGETADVDMPEETADADHQPMEILTAMDDLEDLDSWLKEFVSEYDEIDGDIHEVCDGIYWSDGGRGTDTDLGGCIMPGYQDFAASQQRLGPRWPEEKLDGHRRYHPEASDPGLW